MDCNGFGSVMYIASIPGISEKAAEANLEWLG